MPPASAALNQLPGVFGREGRRSFRQVIPSELPDNLIYTRRIPLGVVALITPWNFPLAHTGVEGGGGLVCGTIVFKPASNTPWCAQLLTGSRRSRHPKRRVERRLVLAARAMPLVQHRDVAAISLPAAMRSGGGCTAWGDAKKKVQCEMGGKTRSSCSMMPTSIWRRQRRCRSVLFDRSALHRDLATVVMTAVLPRFCELVVEKARAFKGQAGDGAGCPGRPGGGRQQKQLSTVLGYLDIGKREARKLLLGGDRLTGELGGGCFIAPTVFSEVKASHRIFRKDLRPRRRSLPPKMKRRPSRWPMTAAGLSSSVYTRDVGRVFRYIDRGSRPASCTSTVRRWAAKPRCRLGASRTPASAGASRHHRSTSSLSGRAWYIDYTGTRRTASFY